MAIPCEKGRGVTLSRSVQKKSINFSDDRINVTWKLKFVVGKVEKNVEKGRKCWFFLQFLLFPQSFKNLFFTVSLNP